MFRMKIVPLVFILVASTALDALAQYPLGFVKGSRVRLSMANDEGAVRTYGGPERPKRWIGTVVSIGADSLTIDLEGREERLQLPFSSISKIETYIGPSEKGPLFWKGFGIGFLIGGGVGVLAGYASGDDEPGFVAFTAAGKALFAGVFLGLLGATLGGIVGVANANKQWEEVPNLELGVWPQPGGLGVSVAFGF